MGRMEMELIWRTRAEGGGRVMQQARATARRTESRGTVHLTFKGMRTPSPSDHCYSHSHDSGRYGMGAR